MPVTEMKKPVHTRPEVDSDTEKKKILGAAKEILALKDLMFGNRILVATYMPEKRGSVILAHHTDNENKWQGKIGLVIALGSSAFQDDERYSFNGQKAEIGDWIWFNVSEAGAADYCPIGIHDKYPCRILRDQDVGGVVPRPDFFW